MKATITPARLAGTVSAPPSKSVAHRLLICAAFANAPTTLTLGAPNADSAATMSCLEALGARFADAGKGKTVVTPVPRERGTAGFAPIPNATLNCGESGSTLRFLVPVVAALGSGASFEGAQRLAERPLTALRDSLSEAGVAFSEEGAFPLTVVGRLRKRVFTVLGNVSSQYVSGLLFAGAIMGVATVHVLKPIESRPYINLTVEALGQFGVRVSEEEQSDCVTYRVQPGSALVSPLELQVEGDWSGAAFWLCAAAMGNPEVSVVGLSKVTTQGDRGLLSALERLGCSFVESEEGITVDARHLVGGTLDVRDIPDLVPPLAAVAAVSKGTTHITGAARLRLKESDRLKSVSDTLRALGAHVSATDDGLSIVGCPQLKGGFCRAYNDHRIAMMAAIAASRCAGPVTIKGAECVAKSYPAFFDDYQALGGKVKLT